MTPGAHYRDGQSRPMFTITGTTGKDWWYLRVAPLLGLRRWAYRRVFYRVAVYTNLTLERIEHGFYVQTPDQRVWRITSPWGDFEEG